jgi:hypothetical protein
MAIEVSVTLPLFAVSKARKTMVFGVAAASVAPAGWVPAATVSEAPAEVAMLAPAPVVLPLAFTATARYQ